MSYKDKAVQSAYQSGYLKGARRAWIETNGPCRVCGSWDDLEMDHIDPKDKTTHRVWSLSRERRTEELKKCQVLCAKCHQQKTTAQLSKPLTHGTTNGYKKHGCRCAACKAVMKAQLAARKAKLHSSGETRTPDPWFMKPVLSPSELRCPDMTNSDTSELKNAS